LQEDKAMIRESDAAAKVGNIEQQFSGWRIAEAIECCADPDLLSACVAAHRVWRDAGSPSAFSFLSEYVNGNEAYRYNQHQVRLKEISDRKDQSEVRIRSFLVGHLLAGRVVGWGRRETPTADPKAIPASAWQHLRILDLSKSVVREVTPAKTRIFDVRIFPLIESADAIDRVEGRKFGDAFQVCLLDDPQLTAARKRAIGSGGAPASFGNAWPPYRAVWPVVLAGSLFIEPATALAEKTDEVTTDDLVRTSNRIQCQRFSKLLGFFRSGRLLAEGVPAAGGANAAIPPAIWHRDGIYIDLESGDLLEASSRAKDRLSRPLKPLFTGLVLRKPESAHRLEEVRRAEIVPIATRKISKSKKNVTSKTTIERACCDWLVDLMRRSPDVRPEIQELYWREAQMKWPESLSGRGFQRAWLKAVEEASAPEWSAAGRPRKSVQAKSPQQ
jgi:hypothetical protein